MLSVMPGRLRPLDLAATAVFPNLRDSWSLVARKPEGWSAQREVPPAMLASILSHLQR